MPHDPASPRISAATLAKYLARRAEDVERCRSALRGGDLAPIAEIGHRLKGSGSTYGFDELSVLGAALEAAAEAVNGSAAERLVDELAGWVSAHPVGTAPQE